MGNLCGKEIVLTQELKEQLFYVTITKEIGPIGDELFSLATTSIKAAYPAAIVLQNTVYSGDPQLFVLEMNFLKLYSSHLSGPVSNNIPQLLQSIKSNLELYTKDLQEPGTRRSNRSNQKPKKVSMMPSNVNFQNQQMLAQEEADPQFQVSRRPSENQLSLSAINIVSESQSRRPSAGEVPSSYHHTPLNNNSRFHPISGQLTSFNAGAPNALPSHIPSHVPSRILSQRPSETHLVKIATGIDINNLPDNFKVSGFKLTPSKPPTPVY